MLGHEIELSPGDVGYIDILLGILGNVKDIPEWNEEVASLIKEQFQTLSSILITFRGSNSILIYAERIKSLLNDFSKLGAEEELDSKTDEIERLKSQVEMEKRKF